MPPAGYEPTFPKNERLQSYVLDRTANWIGVFKWLLLLIISVVMSDPDATEAFGSCVPINCSVNKSQSHLTVPAPRTPRQTHKHARWHVFQK